MTEPPSASVAMAPTAGPAILLLHGQPGGARDWNRVIAELSDQVTLPRGRGGGVAGRRGARAGERVSALVLAAPAANRAALEWFDRWLTFPVAGPLTTAASLTGLGLALSLAPVRGWRTDCRRSARRPGSSPARLTGWCPCRHRRPWPTRFPAPS